MPRPLLAAAVCLALAGPAWACSACDSPAARDVRARAAAAPARAWLALLTPAALLAVVALIHRRPPGAR